MNSNEAVRIPALLAARRPRPVVEEALIEGIRMLVILGDEVDTVIQYTRNGGAQMPQLSSYDEIAERAAHADELLAKQRASGRKNTTGEGVDLAAQLETRESKSYWEDMVRGPQDRIRRPRECPTLCTRSTQGIA